MEGRDGFVVIVKDRFTGRDWTTKKPEKKFGLRNGLSRATQYASYVNTVGIAQPSCIELPAIGFLVLGQKIRVLLKNANT